ncbi:hypothetical protein F7725_004483 [Dissostichus mawsoni]|uniref:Uncharacterized protein n=1 Tax=Dissostichus mawsoni TaxID=36200 RepID=A0A7J5XKA0_DISMA|nr:hypothetical protein F7725_004483 [Dissostichus mawsoni]
MKATESLFVSAGDLLTHALHRCDYQQLSEVFVVTVMLNKEGALPLRRGVCNSIKTVGGRGGAQCVMEARGARSVLRPRRLLGERQRLPWRPNSSTVH